jgi:hypothetical protein
MRDYRDAKAMAQSLREALAEKAVTVTHSECLELVAKSLGVETWNVLSAKIESARQAPHAAAPAEEENVEKKTLYCSFCGKSQHEVKKLIAGPKVFICDECIAMCADIVVDGGLYRLKLEDITPEHDMVRQATDDQLAAFLRASERGLKWPRDVLHQISARLAFADLNASPLMSGPAQRFNSKTREELQAQQQSLEADIAARERANAAVQAVLEERSKI